VEILTGAWLAKLKAAAEAKMARLTKAGQELCEEMMKEVRSALEIDDMIRQCDDLLRQIRRNEITSPMPSNRPPLPPSNPPSPRPFMDGPDYLPPSSLN